MLLKRKVIINTETILGEVIPFAEFSFRSRGDITAGGKFIPQMDEKLKADTNGHLEVELYTIENSFVPYRARSLSAKNYKEYTFDLAPGDDIYFDVLINLSTVPETLPFSLQLLSALYSAIDGYVLTDISFASAAAVTAEDIILTAIGKIAAQINNLAAAVAGNTTDISGLESEVDDIYDELDDKIEIAPGAGTINYLAKFGDDGRITDSGLSEADGELLFNGQHIEDFLNLDIFGGDAFDDFENTIFGGNA